jgi:hypothetical protein
LTLRSRSEKEHRDALWGALASRLAGIGDVWLRLKAEDYAEAEKLGRLYRQDLRLMQEIGWRPEQGAAADLFTLRMDSGELATIATRLRDEAKEAVKAGGEERKAAEAFQAHTNSYALLAEGCQGILGALALAAETQAKR